MYAYNIDFLTEVDSTNLYVKQKAAQHRLPDRYAVSAQHQTAGRGQRGNVWVSDPYKNILMSLYVPEPGPAESLSRLNNAVALAIVDTLTTSGVKNARIKWPNDIYVGDRKIAGVLTDTVVRDGVVVSAVVGLGLNVNQINFPVHLATSMAAITGVEWDVVELLHQLYDFFYTRLSQPQEALLSDVNILLYKKGEYVTFGNDERTVIYRVLGINHNGNLEVEFEGIKTIVQHHTMKWIK